MFTGRPTKVNNIVSTFPPGAAVVGEIAKGEPGKVEVLDLNGQKMHGFNQGWDHFARLSD